MPFQFMRRKDTYIFQNMEVTKNDLPTLPTNVLESMENIHNIVEKFHSVIKKKSF